MNTILLAFLTGLTSGGISCFAVQGGLLATSLTNQGEDKKANWKLVLMFLAAKLIVYTLLGMLLGLIGSVFIISTKLQGIIQMVIGGILIATALRLLDIHPLFRYFAITPPKFIYRLLKEKSVSASYFAPAMLGALTVLVPCGISQSMMLLSISSKSVLSGGLILAAFILGTSPVFFALGLGVVELLKKKAFVVISAILIFIMAAYSINSGLALLGSTFTFQQLFNKQGNSVQGLTIGKNGKQYVEITVNNYGYQASTQTLKVGVPVTLKLITNDIYSCSRAFTIPGLNIRTVLPPTGSQTIEFTPTSVGTLVYTCSMGMYTGSFRVIR